MSAAGRLEEIRARIAAASERAGRRRESVGLLAVSKTFGAGSLAALAAAGQDDFGESYVQEALGKIEATETQAGRSLCWHFIGPVQSNKTAAIAARFAWVHGVERLKIAERLSTQRSGDQAPLNVCVQVNVSGEASKAGCAPDEAAALCAAIARLPRLRLRGLMCIPEADAGLARSAFRALRELQAQIREAGAVDTGSFDTLSMGMSDDFEIAIEEGATWVRIGSALFGRRDTRR